VETNPFRVYLNFDKSSVRKIPKEVPLFFNLFTLRFFLPNDPMNFRLFLFAFFLSVLSSYFSFGQQNFENAGSSGRDLNKNRFVVTVNGGLGYLTGSTKKAIEQMEKMEVTDSDIHRYFRDLKTGGFYSASVHFMVNPTLGLGVDYNLFTTRGEVKGFIDPGDGWTKYYGIFSDKIYTSFLGLSFLSREKISGKWGYYSKFSSGMAFYRDEASVVNSPLLITGKSIAMYGESGLGYVLSKQISLNMGISYFLSKLGKVKSNNGYDSTETKLPKDAKENLSKINLSAGVSFHF
jgi:hypothetical protein